MKHRLAVCERCGRSKPSAELIVHHKIPLTPDNINDTSVTLNWDNLMLVCRSCHAALHSNESTAQGLFFDEKGNILKEEGPISPPEIES